MSVSVLSLKSSIWIQVLLYRYRPSYIKQHPVSDTRVPSFAVVPSKIDLDLDLDLDHMHRLELSNNVIN